MTSADLDARLAVVVDTEGDPVDVDEALAKFLLSFVRSKQPRSSSAAPAAEVELSQTPEHKESVS